MGLKTVGRAVALRSLKFVFRSKSSRRKVAILYYRVSNRWMARGYYREFRMASDSHSEVFYIALNFLASNTVRGDIYEFGVATGKTAWIIAKHIRRPHIRSAYENTALHLYDSFEGLPEPRGHDTYTSHWRKGMFSEITVDPDSFEKSLSSQLNGNVKVVKGFYSDLSLDQVGTTKIALLHLDCDLYESSIDALKLVGPLFQDGTVILCDDYWAFKGRFDAGEQRALAEYFSTRPDLRQRQWFSYGWHGQAIIVNTVSV